MVSASDALLSSALYGGNVCDSTQIVISNPSGRYNEPRAFTSK
jgi:hypothetical protein